MKISKQQLNQIIKEELNAVIEEAFERQFPANWLDAMSDSGRSRWPSSRKTKKREAEYRADLKAHDDAYEEDRRDKEQGIGRLSRRVSDNPAYKRDLEYDEEATWGAPGSVPPGPVDLDLSDEEDEEDLTATAPYSPVGGPSLYANDLIATAPYSPVSGPDPDEDDEDLISTTVVPPVSGPEPDEDDEDLISTTVVPPVSGPDPDEDDQDLISTTVVPPVAGPTPPGEEVAVFDPQDSPAPGNSGQTYPATELTALAATLRNIVSQSGVPFPGGNVNMVDEFEKVLRSGGYALNEAKDERIFIGQEGNIEISADSAPDLVRWLAMVKEKAPDVFTSLVAKLANYRFDLPVELGAAEADEEEEEDPAGEDPAGEDPAGEDPAAEPERKSSEGPAESWEDLSADDVTNALNLLRRTAGNAGAQVLRIADIEAARDLALEKLETSKSKWAPQQRAVLELTTQKLIDLLRTGLGKKEEAVVVEWTRLERQAAGILLESTTRRLNESKEKSRWKVLSGIK